MNNQRKQTDFYKVVNFDGNNEIEVLDYVFDHGNGFKGATGTRFEPIPKDYYKQATSKDNVIEYLEGCYTDEELFERWGSGRSDDSIPKCLGRLYKDIKQAGEIDMVVFDDSYSHLWDYLREELNLSDKEAYIFTCTGGGRMFGKDYQGNVNPELSAIIREYEAG